MRGHINDCLRTLISSAVNGYGLIASAWLRLRMIRYSRNQETLKLRYKINQETPVSSYGARVVESIQQAAAKAGWRARFAQTSGSTGKAKEILYTKRRLLSLKLTFSDMYARACRAFQVKHTSLYVFNSFQTDASLTSLLLYETTLPNYFTTLQAPYRAQHTPAIRALVSKYGAAAVRLWILTISNPGVLYSTNPSTISTFFDELATDWHRSSKLIRDWYETPAAFPPEVHRIARRLASRDCARRLRQIATSESPLSLSICAPAVEAFICWTGGYVKPFLDQLDSHLPAPRYCLIPMYSMSTETIETLPYFRGNDVAFLPIADGVVYEFIAETNEDSLLNPHQLEPGKLYAMIVSDAYGLRRYQTDDLFLCRRKINGLPDLVFVRRRSLQYSFTGEKLTAEQLSTAFEQLRAIYPAVLAGRFLTCIPSHSAGGLPHYTLLLIGHHPVDDRDLIAVRCDELLCEINCEYRSKRASGRLGRIECTHTDIRDFAETFAGNSTWETQFKFLPLIRNPVLI